jgi:pilus assembly protein Flp/PilA
MKTTILRFLRDEEGAAAVEYGLLVALIALAVVIAVRAIGANLNTVFGKVRDCLAAPSTAACT